MSVEDLDLNAVASEAMSESKPLDATASTETKETTTAVTPDKEQTSKVEKTVTQDSSSTPKLSRRQAAAKEASDYRIQSEKDKTEWNRQRTEYENKLKQFDPILPYVAQFKQAAEEQKRQEELQRYQTNPQQASETRMQEMIQQAILPYQQQAQMQELDNFTNNSLSQIKSYAGSEETYNAVSPYMKEILDSTMKTDPDAADKLARSPEFLFRVARDIYNEQNKQVETKQVEQNTLKNQESKAEMAKFNGGVSKPNRFAKTNSTPSRETARTNAYDFIREITGNK